MRRLFSIRYTLWDVLGSAVCGLTWASLSTATGIAVSIVWGIGSAWGNSRFRKHPPGFWTPPIIQPERETMRAKKPYYIICYPTPCRKRP